jgi:hypothetical protein
MTIDAERSTYKSGWESRGTEQEAYKLIYVLD